MNLACSGCECTANTISFHSIILITVQSKQKRSTDLYHTKVKTLYCQGDAKGENLVNLNFPALFGALGLYGPKLDLIWSPISVLTKLLTIFK